MKTPKEKAEELFYKYLEVDGTDFNVKQCALIAVDEILKTNSDESIYGNAFSKYWQEVKQEIELL